MNHVQPETTAPSLLKLGACLVYEVLTVAALSFICAGLFVLLAGDATHGIKRLLMQLFLWAAIGAYFVRCWVKSGQTLAMQAWRIRLLNQENQPLSLKQAVARYLAATFSLALCGAGFLWAIVDRDKLFLHDRLLKSRLVIQQKQE